MFTAWSKKGPLTLPVPVIKVLDKDLGAGPAGSCSSLGMIKWLGAGHLVLTWQVWMIRQRQLPEGKGTLSR